MCFLTYLFRICKDKKQVNTLVSGGCKILFVYYNALCVTTKAEMKVNTIAYDPALVVTYHV